jgi:hypothetical protein
LGSRAEQVTSLASAECAGRRWPAPEHEGRRIKIWT